MTIPDLTKDGNKRPTFRSKRSSWLKWIWRIFLVIIILIAVFLGILSLASGTSPERRAGLESILSEVMDKKVTIETLNYMEVFPTISIDMQGISIAPPEKNDLGDEIKEQSANKAQRVIEIGHLVIKVSFWDYIFGLDSLKDLEISKLIIPPDEKGDRLLAIERLALDPSAFIPFEGFAKPEDISSIKALPGLVLAGRYGEEEFFMQAHLPTKRNSNQNITQYVLDRASPFLAGFGNVNATGTIHLARHKDIKLNNLKLASDGKELLKGHLTIGQDQSAHTSPVLRSIDGALDLGESSLAIDIAQIERDSEELWAGEMFVSPLKMRDIIGKESSLSNLLKAISSLDKERHLTQDSDNEEDKPEEKPIEFKEPYMDLSIRAEPVNASGEKIGELKGRFVKGPRTFRLENILGQISKGSLKAHYHLDKSDQKNGEESYELNSSLEVLNLDYGHLQEAVTDGAFAHGDADIHLTLEGKGRSESELRRSLQGRLSVIAAKGELTSSSLNFWGGGLVNALIPNKDKAKELRLNCALMDFDIKQGIGKAKSLFLDTKRVQVVGKGKFNLVDETIDLVLTPNAKSTALFDVATAINVTGPLTDPKVSPNALSLGKKIGGLLVGAINPAFLAISITDFGISKEHPCMESVKQLRESVNKGQDDDKMQVDE